MTSNYFDKCRQLWGMIDRIDQKHAEINMLWQQSEVKTIISKLKTFHFDHKPDEYISLPYNKLSSIIERYEAGEEIDFRTMDTLKDMLHKIFQSEEYTERWESDIYEGKPKSFFNRESFYETTYFGHGKENAQHSEDRRAYFFHHYLKKDSEEMADCFFTMLHDIAQTQGHARIVTDIKDWLDWYEKKLINFAALDQYIKTVVQIIHLELSRGESTWGVDEIRRRYWVAREYFHDIARFVEKKQTWNNGYYMTEEEIYNSVNCRRGNCNTRIKLTKLEKFSLENGNGLDPKVCTHHTKLDEYGHDESNDEIGTYPKVIPKLPVILRWLGLDEDDDWREKTVIKYNAFIKMHRVKVLADRLEKCVNGHMDEDRKIRIYNYRVLYLRIEDEKTFNAFFDTFRHDFSSNCSDPEILKNEKQIEDYNEFAVIETKTKTKKGKRGD